MKRFWENIAILLLVGMPVVGFANVEIDFGLQVNNDCRCVAEQGTLSVEITPLSNPQSDVDFYDYNTIPASSNTGLEVPQQSRLYLYENSNTGDISLISNHDIPFDSTGGRVDFAYSGLPSGSFYSVRDDNPGNDSYTGPVAGNATAQWSWVSCCTDGAAIRLGEECDFEITTTPSFIAGITSWVLLSGDISSPDVIPLPSLTDEVTIRCTSCQPLCDQRTQGFWRRVCKKPHPEELNGVDPYVDDVVALGTPIFDGFDAGDICDLMAVSPPENDPCRKARRQFIALLLNIASDRLTTCQGITDGSTVQDAIDEIKALLTSGTDDDCKEAQGLAAEINEGTALVDCNSRSSSPTGVDISLSKNSPNPFSSTTTIHYILPAVSSQQSAINNPTRVRLAIYDITGRVVRTLVDGVQEVGNYTVEWNGKNSREQEVPNGIYFYHLQMGDYTATKKLILLR